MGAPGPIIASQEAVNMIPSGVGDIKSSSGSPYRWSRVLEVILLGVTSMAIISAPWCLSFLLSFSRSLL
jgi:hypothetical protein